MHQNSIFSFCFWCLYQKESIDFRSKRANSTFIDKHTKLTKKLQCTKHWADIVADEVSGKTRKRSAFSTLFAYFSKAMLLLEWFCVLFNNKCNHSTISNGWYTTINHTIYKADKKRVRLWIHFSSVARFTLSFCLVHLCHSNSLLCFISFHFN